MAGVLIADIETDGVYPTVIWMVGVLDYETDEFTSYVGEDVAAGLMRMWEADLLIGHNIIDYDIKHIERLTDQMLTFDRSKVIDTLQASRRICNLNGHSLRAWGDLLGLPKLASPLFESFTPEMIPYCERDCRLNKAVFDTLMEIDPQKVLAGR